MAMSRKTIRRRFGIEIRRQREQAGLTQQQVAAALHVSQSHISDVESGKKGLGTRQIPRLDSVLTADGELVKRWQDLNRTNGYAEWFDDIVVVEQDAAEIRLYQSSVVPGLFQTSDYAAALVRLGNSGATSAYVNGKVEGRLKRQEILEVKDNQEGPVVTAVLEEHVLRRPIGGWEVMAAQLDKLVTLARSPRVTIQVIPMNTPEHYGMDGSFAVFTVPDRGHLTYTETRVSSDPRDDLEAVDSYMGIFANLRGVALPPQASHDFMEQIRSEFDA